MLRVGNFALAVAGTRRNVQSASFGIAGRSNFALNRILATALVMARRYRRARNPQTRVGVPFPHGRLRCAQT